MKTICGVVFVMFALCGRPATAIPLLVVTQYKADKVSVFDTADSTRRPSLSIDHGPLGLVAHPNGRYAFVVTANGPDVNCGGNLQILDTDTNEIVHCLDLGAGGAVNDLAINPAGTRLYALKSAGRKVVVVSFTFADPTNTRIKQPISLLPGGGTPSRLAMHPDGKRLYVSVPGADEVQEISLCEPDCSAVVARYPVGAKPMGLAVTPGGESLFVSSESADRVTAIDTETGAQTPIELAAGSGPVAVAIHPARPEIYVADRANDTISVIDVTDLKAPVVTPIAVNDSPLDVSVHPWGDRLYVAHGGNKHGSIIDLATHAVSTVDLGGAQNRIAFVDFTTEDVVISDPGQTLIDPEIDARNNRIVWQDLSVVNSSMWIANLDPATGAIDPPDGRGQLIDDGLAPLVETGNGPEWAFGADSTKIVYTDTDASGRDHVAMAYQDDAGDWVLVQLAGGAGRNLVLGSKLTDATPAFMSYRAGTHGGSAIAWRDLDNAPDVEHIAGLAQDAGFWAEGRPAFVYTKSVDTGGEPLLQVHMYDVNDGRPVEITADAQNKYLASMWWAPDYGAYLMMCTVSNNRLGIYRDDGAGWALLNTIYLPSQHRYVHSPEPFVFEGKSYLSVVAAQMLGDGSSEMGQPTGETEIWIASVRPDEPFFRRVSDPTHVATRKDPETYETTSGVVVLYSEKDRRSGVWLLRRAATGL